MTATRASLRLFLSASLLAAGVATAQVPELETVFFGRIINRTGGQEYQLTSGTVSWTIPNSGSTPITITGEIGTLQQGRYSYVLKIPHQAKSLDLQVDREALPLKASDAGFEVTTILVNGRPASPVGSTAGFVASQPKRGGVHRLDLEVFDPIEDSDGDGIPDWWEDRYGLDKQLASDAKLRFGGNRYTYLEAYRLGIDPRVDDQLPQLLTTELTVGSQGSTGLLLRTVASSSVPEQIVYRLTAAPVGGSLILRNARPDPKLSDLVLGQGGTFTQADVEAGRVEFSHTDLAIRTLKLKFQIVAAGRAASPVDGEVTLNVYRPSPVDGRSGAKWVSARTATEVPEATSAPELWKKRATDDFAMAWEGASQQKNEIAAFLLSRWFDYTIWDGRNELPSYNLSVPSAGLTAKKYAADYLPRYGRARSHVLFAGKGPVRLEGGMSGDILIAGEGSATLRGQGGPDIFVVGSKQTTIEDFSIEQRDTLDLSPLLQGAPGPLADRVTVTTSAGTSYLDIPLGGDKAARIVLRDLVALQDTLESWRRSGILFTGGISPGAAPANQAPVANPDAGYIVAGQQITISVLANDRDPDGDGLVIESITQGARGTAEIVGDNILYTPSAGFDGRDEFSYTISDGQGGLATGRVTLSYPYPAAAGTYAQVVLSPDGAPIGAMTVTLLQSGAFTTKLVLRGVTYTGRGQFDEDGNGTVVVRAGKRTVNLVLNIDLADPTFPLRGTIESPDETTEIGAAVAANSAAVRLPLARKYTLSMQSPSGESVGHGFAIANVSRKSAVRILGQTADGEPFAAAVVQRRDGSVSWSAPLYKKKGWLLGNWSLVESSGIALGGTTKWVRLADAGAAGFERTLATDGSLYTAPSVGAVSALHFTDATTRVALLALSGGGLAQSIVADATFRIADGIQFPAGTPLRLQLNRANGLLSGHLTSDNARQPIRGVILQNKNRGTGFFLNGSHSGSLELTPQ